MKPAATPRSALPQPAAPQAGFRLRRRIPRSLAIAPPQGGAFFVEPHSMTPLALVGKGEFMTDASDPGNPEGPSDAWDLLTVSEIGYLVLGRGSASGEDIAGNKADRREPSLQCLPRRRCRSTGTMIPLQLPRSKYSIAAAISDRTAQKPNHRNPARDYRHPRTTFPYTLPSPANSLVPIRGNT
jgi:hypothetical protein